MTESDIDDINESSNYNNNREYKIYIEFKSGYYFRQLFEYASAISNELPLFCDKNYITTNRANDTRTIIVNNIINPQNLTRYIFNEKYASHRNSEQCFHVINMNFIEAKKYIKNISKTGGVRLYQYVDDESNNTYLQYFGDKSDDHEEIPIPNIQYTLSLYSIEDENARDTTNPNVTVCLKSFCNKISEIHKMKYHKLIFRTFSKGVHIYCLDAKNVLKRTICFGESYQKNVDNKPNDAFDIIFTDQFMKALSKTSTFNSDGIIRIYCSQNNAVRLEIPVSCFGTSITYLTVPQLK